MKHQFKFRAECLMDVVSLLGQEESCILAYTAEPETIDQMPLPDVVVAVTVKDGTTLDDLNQQMLLVSDSHVMRETLATVEEYTGERNRP